MLKTFMLILHLQNPATGFIDTYVLDTNLTPIDCITAQNDHYFIINPNAHFTCEPETTSN